MVVQSWFTLYQCLIMGVVLMVLWYPQRRQGSSFHWSWAIPLISLFLCVADFAYFTALAQEGSLIAVVSMVRRGSVLVSFLCGAILFREKNLRSKFADLLLVLLGMLFLYWGTKG
jgi:drug/metabolite transporter (DMT)-like permease